MTETTPSAALADCTVTPQELQEAVTLEVGSLRIQLMQSEAARGKLEAKVRELEAKTLELASRVPDSAGG